MAVHSLQAAVINRGKLRGRLNFPLLKSELKRRRICWLPKQKVIDLTSKCLGRKGVSQQMLLWFGASNLTTGN